MVLYGTEAEDLCPLAIPMEDLDTIQRKLSVG